MNRIAKNGNNTYTLTTSSGETFTCTRWYEKKTNAWHVKLPANNPTGRTYIRESFVVNGSYEFDDKTTGHRVLGPTGGWKARMTPEESKKVAEAEALIESIKTVALARVPQKLDLNSVEGIEAEIARLMAKKAQLPGIKVEPEVVEPKAEPKAKKK